MANNAYLKALRKTVVVMVSLWANCEVGGKGSSVAVEANKLSCHIHH